MSRRGGFFGGRIRYAVAAVVLSGFAMSAAAIHAEEAAKRLLPLDFELVDTSGEPTDQRIEHARRIELTRNEILRQLEIGGTYQIVGQEKIAAELAGILDHTYLRSCNGCEFALGEHAGAEWVMTGQINKVSTLLMNMRVWIKNTHTRETVFFQSFDFRGDNDNAWMRAARYIGQRIVEIPPG